MYKHGSITQANSRILKSLKAGAKAAAVRLFMPTPGVTASLKAAAAKARKANTAEALRRLSKASPAGRRIKR